MILLHDTQDLLNIIKKASIEAVETSKPSDFCYGKVISVSPLQISIEQKLTLGKAQLVLTRNVTDYSIDVTLDWNTESANDHKHNVTGVKKITIHNGLKVDDRVVLLKKKGGQKYLVLDRVVSI